MRGPMIVKVWPRVAVTLCLAFTALQTAQSATDSDVHLIYLHGRIIEEKGPTPTHPKFGLYDYPSIVEALGSLGATVISEQRPSGTKVDDYARKTLDDIDKLIKDGVSPNNIVVVGFSKGGGIAIRVANLGENPEIRYVLLASCADWLRSYPKLHLTGHVLSVMETSDNIGKSCKDLAARGSDVASFDEIEISTGKQHGAFYTPDPVWLTPVLNWVHHNKDKSENSIE